MVYNLNIRTEMLSLIGVSMGWAKVIRGLSGQQNLCDVWK